MKDMWVRPYSADAGLLADAVQKGFQPKGLMVDANIVAYFPEAGKACRTLAAESGIPFAIDPNTAKLRSAHFRAKPSFSRLPWYSGPMPSVRDLIADSSALVTQTVDYQLKWTTSVVLSPYVLLTADHFPDTALVQLQSQWYRDFLATAPKELPRWLSLCITGAALATPDGASVAFDMMQKYQGEGVYLVLTDYELGDSSVTDTAVLAFLDRVSESLGMSVMLGRAPFWAPLLFTHGANGFVTGINFLATMKSEYLTREEDIGGMQHNYYIPRRFTKATSDAVEEMLAAELIEPCPCPFCRAGIPRDTNDIRKHYLFARQSEIDDLNSSGNIKETLRMWLEETASFITECDAEAIKIINRTPTHLWLRALA